MRHDFWVADMADVDWDAVAAEYRPLLDRITTRSEFADVLWEVFGELGTSHAYVVAGWRPAAEHGPGLLGADLERTAMAGGSAGCCAARPPTRGRVRRWPRPAPTSRGRRPAARDRRPAGRAGRTGPAAGRHGGQAGRARGRRRGRQPAPQRRGRAAGQRPAAALPGLGQPQARRGARARRRPGRLPARARHGERGLGGLPPRPAQRDAARRADRRRPRQQRRPHLAAGRGEAGPPRHRLGRAARPGALDLPRGRAARPGGGARRRVRGIRRRHRHGGDQGPRARPGGRRADLGRRRRLRRAARAGRRDARSRCRGSPSGSSAYGWGVENHGVDPDVEVIPTPDDWAADRDVQLETAVRLALEALRDRPAVRPPDPATRPSRRRPSLPPRSR